MTLIIAKATPWRLAIVSLALLAAPAMAAPSLDVQCDDGVCAANLADDTLAVAPCEKAGILLAWREAGGAALIQCETDDAPMDRPSFAYDRDHPLAPAFALTGTRFLVSSFLADAARGGVPDAFSGHPLCVPPRPPRMADGEILLGEKVPSDAGGNPYCYRVLRVATTSTGVAIRADDHDSPKADTRHAEWDKLAANMTALIRASEARVASARAPLRDAADPGAALHGYLVRGDAVTVLDRARTAGGWLKVRYVGKSGQAVERWIQANDLAPATH